jgi:hypothetical protein
MRLICNTWKRTSKTSSRPFLELFSVPLIKIFFSCFHLRQNTNMTSQPCSLVQSLRLKKSLRFKSLILGDNGTFSIRDKPRHFKRPKNVVPFVFANPGFLSQVSGVVVGKGTFFLQAYTCSPSCDIFRKIGEKAKIDAQSEDKVSLGVATFPPETVSVGTQVLFICEAIDSSSRLRVINTTAIGGITV